MTINRARNKRKKLLERKFLDLKKWVKSIQTAGYNGARTVYCRYFGPQSNVVMGKPQV